MGVELDQVIGFAVAVRGPTHQAQARTHDVVQETFMRERQTNTPRHFLGWASIAVPIVGLVVSMIVAFHCGRASDTEPIGRFLGLMFGLFVAGVIVLIVAILGLVFASYSQNRESCPRLSSVGTIISAMMILMLFLIPVALTALPGLFRALERWVCW